MPSGLEILDTRTGEGAIANQGDTVVVHYRGFLNRGEQFQNTYEEGTPITFKIGRRRVIAGLETGVIGMRVGGLRKLRVSPHLAYRDRAIPDRIPANAVLEFEVELIEVRGGVSKKSPMINRLPLVTLPAPFEAAKRIRDLREADIREMLRNGRVRFVVAAISEPLRVILESDCYGFWDKEVKPHLADPDQGSRLESFPGEYCYFASEWFDGATPIVLLSTAH